MVEPILEDPILRASTATPTPSRKGYYHLRNGDQGDQRFDSTGPSKASPGFYDTAAPDSGKAFYDSTPSNPDITGGDIGSGPNSMRGDANGGMSDSSSMPDHSKAGSNRRGSRSQSASTHRPSGPPGAHPLQQPSSSHGYAVSPSQTSSSESAHNTSGFQGSSLHYQSGGLPYNQRSGYVGQYTMSSQPSLSMAHTPPPFAYPHAFHHPGVPDGSMISPNIHASYPSMLQPHAPVYQYQQRHSPEGGSTSHASFSGSRSSPIYAHHQVNNPPTPNSPMSPSSAGPSSAHSPSYVRTGQFHSLQYPSPMPSPQYGYPPQSFPTSPPMYQSTQFAPSPYAQHFASAPEAEPGGTWWYMPAVPSQQQYDSGPPSYQGHYQMPYPSMSHHDVDTSYSGNPGSASAPSPTPLYPMSPVAQAFSPEHPPSSPASRPRSLAPPQVDGAIGSSGSSAGGGPRNLSDKPVVRRSYHPNPPAHRSEWVMWAGNVPSDASHDELWRFFNQPPERSSPSEKVATGVMSIFLISRSSCAFVNFESETHLHEAISRFNGKPLRPADPRCPRLVCRVRRKDDDLKAGVGGQRGMGMHTRWIKDMKGKGRPSTYLRTLRTPCLRSRCRATKRERAILERSIRTAQALTLRRIPASLHVISRNDTLSSNR
ncbi:hypothetical protein BDQ12DRAFT_338185 [Crucibulum laeve]|uniref:YTH1-like RRM domain-containing protein n=1 Tax=Crucibulum laeve TaxID=68775 RepID=A0A5C3LRW3_9AGAR|nr:hypothetical protein BDQ12DRAFT_338185 [Crucibulum laeve]